MYTLFTTTFLTHMALFKPQYNKGYIQPVARSNFLTSEQLLY